MATTATSAEYAAGYTAGHRDATTGSRTTCWHAPGTPEGDDWRAGHTAGLAAGWARAGTPVPDEDDDDEDWDYA